MATTCQQLVTLSQVHVLNAITHAKHAYQVVHHVVHVI